MREKHSFYFLKNYQFIVQAASWEMDLTFEESGLPERFKDMHEQFKPMYIERRYFPYLQRYLQQEEGRYQTLTEEEQQWDISLELHRYKQARLQWREEQGKKRFD